MKIKHFGGMAGVCCLLAAAPAVSAADYETGWYFNAEGGLNLANDVDVSSGGGTLTAEFNAGFRFGAGVGYNITKNIGVEFDTGWIWNGLDKLDGISIDGSLSHIPFMVNGVFRLPMGAKWEGYAGGGVGGSYSILCIDDGPIDDSDGDIVFAWQLLTGVRYKLTDAMSLGAGYKYFGTAESDYEIAGIPLTTDNTHNHTFSVVFNWKF